MKVTRVRRTLVARSVIALSVLLAFGLGQFFLSDPRASATPRTAAGRSVARKWPARARCAPVLLPPRELSPGSHDEATSSAEAPGAEASAVASAATATDEPSQPTAEPNEAPSPLFGATGSGPAVTDSSKARAPRMTTIHVRGRVSGRDENGNGDDTPMAGTTVRLITFVDTDVPSREGTSALQLGAVRLHERWVVREADGRRVSELASMQTGDDGRFSFSIQRDRLPEKATLYLVGGGTLDGVGYRIEPKELRLRHAELTAFDDDDWDVGVQRIELQKTRVVRVTVRSAGRPIAGACVATSDGRIAAMTGPSGRAELEVTFDESQFEVTAAGFANEGASADGEGDAEVAVELHRPVDLVVEVVDEDGRPVSGIEVSGSSDVGGSLGGATTGSDGRAALSLAVEGREYAIYVTPRDSRYLGARASATAGRGAKPTRVVLRRCGNVTVAVTFDDDVPAAVQKDGVELVLEKLEAEGWTSGGSQSHGSVASALAKGEKPTFTNLEPGTYRVTAIPKDGQLLAIAFTTPFTVSPSDSTAVSVEVTQGVVLSGWVKDASGELVGQGDVRFAETAGTFSISSGHVDVRIPRGAALTAIIDCSGYEKLEARISAADGRLPRLQLVPRRN